MNIKLSQEKGRLVDEIGQYVPIEIKKKEHVDAVKKYLQEASSEDVIKLVSKLLKQKKE